MARHLDTPDQQPSRHDDDAWYENWRNSVYEYEELKKKAPPEDDYF